MIVPLFEKIHTHLDYDREYPATLYEFLDFGLLPSDYIEYVGLQQIFQGAILLEGVSPKNTKTKEAFSALIEFCLQKT